jgi:peroxiredoxin Q/BCP
LGISFDDQATNAAFAEKFSFPYKLLCDTEKSVGTAYDGIRPSGTAKRITYLIDPEGRVARAWDSVTAKTHATVVLNAIG